jgi:AraC-like DNA-binding protein
MIEIKYDLTTYHKFLADFSKYLGTKIIDDTLYIPENAGYGYLKHIELANGAEALLSNLQLTQDLFLERKKNKTEFYTFCCEFISDLKEFSMTIESDTYRLEKNDISAMYLTSFLYDVGYYLRKGSMVNSIRILLSPEWMKKNLAFDKKREVLQQYLELKTAGVLFKKLDAESRQIMTDVFAADVTKQPPLFYHSRLLWLLEKFCSWLTPEIMSRRNALDISRDDIERIRKIEALITADFSVPPLTIAKLAKSIAVSESKLKTLFKAVYGLPVYEYFQKHRMEKARVMLLSNEYSIKDTGYAVGYANLSNFTLAFKKQFGQLPSDLLK